MRSENVHVTNACGEQLVKFHCSCCDAVIDPEEEKFAKFSRGWFGPFYEDEGFDKEHENIKFECFVCEKCFLQDEDLCRFFNKIGMRIR